MNTRALSEPASPNKLTFDLRLSLPIPIENDNAPKGTLDYHHIEEFRQSGIPDALIAASGIRSVPGTEAARLLNWSRTKNAACRGWAIPFDDHNSPACYWRVKLDRPRVLEGRTIKYESPRGSSNRLYRPPGFDDAKGVAIVITEGEKKALSAIGHDINCLGLTGVWNWQRPRKRNDEGRGYGSRHLIDDMTAIGWKDRDVIICFDSDAAEKHTVELAQQKLAEALAKRGAKIKIARLSSGQGGRKLGLDDAIMELGIDAVRDVIDDAEEPELPELSWPDLAKMLIELRHSFHGEPTIRYWRNAFWQWTGSCYEEVDDKSISIEAYQFLQQIGWKPNRSSAAEVVAALQAEVAVESRLEPPASLVQMNSKPSGTPLVFDGEIAFLDFDEFLLHSPLPTAVASPAWFCTGARAFPYEPAATCPEWDGFLECSLPDPVARRLLQQWFGYVLSGRMHHHKLMVMNGAKRSGKSIIADALTRLIGESATSNSTLKELSGDFGLSPLIGKQLLLVPDTSDRGSCLGAVERLKAISGCDRLDVNRKHKPILTNVHLQTRIVITCNQLPRFLDPSGALFYRLLLIHFPISFAGREDLTLPDKIRAEMPGIFNWAHEGWLDLNVSGFVQPPSSADILARAEHIISPIRAFLDEHCVVGSGEKVGTDELWGAWQKWCADTRHHPGNKEKLGNDLSGALPEVQRKQLRIGGLRRYFYEGLDLNEDGKSLLDEWQRSAYRRA